MRLRALAERSAHRNILTQPLEVVAAAPAAPWPPPCRRCPRPRRRRPPSRSPPPEGPSHEDRVRTAGPRHRGVRHQGSLRARAGGHPRTAGRRPRGDRLAPARTTTSPPTSPISRCAATACPRAPVPSASRRSPRPPPRSPRRSPPAASTSSTSATRCSTPRPGSRTPQSRSPTAPPWFLDPVDPCRLNAPLIAEQRQHRSLVDAVAALAATLRQLHGATVISCVSEAVAEWTLDEGADPARVVVTPNGVNTRRITPGDRAVAAYD